MAQTWPGRDFATPMPGGAWKWAVIFNMIFSYIEERIDTG